MNKYAITSTTVFILSSGDVHATTGLSSLEGLWVLFLVFGLIIFTLVILGVFWLKITWVYLIKNESKFYRLKLFIFKISKVFTIQLHHRN